MRNQSNFSSFKKSVRSFGQNFHSKPLPTGILSHEIPIYGDPSA